jgi:hypothetical protein
VGILRWLGIKIGRGVGALRLRESPVRLRAGGTCPRYNGIATGRTRMRGGRFELPNACAIGS